MKQYNIIKLDQDSEYTNLIIIRDANSPFDYISMIKNDLIELRPQGKILIDQILHVGNTNKRFISLKYNLNESENIKMEFVNISKDNLCRKISCRYLKENDLIEYSILSSIQKRMINKGIVI
ncbi:type II toxin-antitoxin system RnlB family antitoxin [Clostridium botulinum]|uniref:type II toxin-antitoxin system RnlB family antitoxin n=1 Tax=Clostridium botulinum TaxID=1491 RepID=UPI0004D9BB1D|nr:type II toxin-antitoxin system RnlB family antitoxin [Clostridium botulinum]KEH94194.1 hypothetical protein Z963_10965 [Clostridium botulinum C/D str. It1]